MADINPWSPAGWNITAQMDYVRRYGVLRAEARARDAGTVLGGPRPVAIGAAPQPWQQPKPAPFVSPKYIIINKIQQVAVVPPPSALFSQEEIHPRLGVDMFSAITRELDMDPLSPAFGYAAAAVVTLELDLPVAAPSIGLTTATSVTLEQDFAAAMIGGLSMASAFQLTRELVDSNALGIGVSVVISLVNGLLSASAALGFNTAASLDTTTLSLGAPSMSLGAAMVSAVTLEQDLSVVPSLGLSMASAMSLEAGLSASSGLGVTMAAALERDKILPSVSPALGATMAASITQVGLIKTFQGTNIQSTAGSSQTWNSAPIGTAAADRFLIIAALTGDPNNNLTVTGVTVNGTAATVATSANGDRISYAFFFIKVTTGTTANIVASFSGTATGNSAIIGLWTVTGSASLAALGVGSLAAVSATSSATRSVASGNPGVSFAIGAGFSGAIANAAATWTGITTVDSTVRTSQATASHDFMVDFVSSTEVGANLSVHFTLPYSSSNGSVYGETVGFA